MSLQVQGSSVLLPDELHVHCRSQSKLLASIVRVGAAPLKRAPAAASNSAQPKRAKHESASPAAPVQSSAAHNGKAQHDHEAQQESSDGEAGLAGLLGGSHL